MAQALRACRGQGIPIGLWPLLPDTAGYWPNVDNVDLSTERVYRALAFAERAGIAIDTIAMDLEPSLAQKHEFGAASWLKKCKLVALRMRSIPQEYEKIANAKKSYRKLAEVLRSRKIESLAIAIPPVLTDFPYGKTLVQKLAGVPVTGVDWDVISPMLYSSMIAEALPGALRPFMPMLMTEACRIVADSGLRSCVSLGVVGRGKMKQEAVYGDVAELQQDVAIALASGATDLALFSLEGVLARKNPERWLEAFTDREVDARNPPLRPSFGAALLRYGTRGIAQLPRLFDT